MTQPPIRSSAVLSECGTYRYSLTRTWALELPSVAFVMLNPSTADATKDDPTIRKCVGFARQWGYGQLEVINLFAFRATDPKELPAAKDPVGPLNNEALLEVAGRSATLVCAWGNHGSLLGRNKTVLELLRENGFGFKMISLRMTKSGHPCHPLYVPYTQPTSLFLGY